MPSDLTAFLAWYVAVMLFGLAALPLGFKFFRHLPDRGYAFAKPLGLLTVCYLFWLLGSLGFLLNDVAGLLFSAAAVVGLGLGWLGPEGRSELRAWLREQRAVVVTVELFFLAAFAVWAWVRAYNPEIVATEKPMEFMFINSILRSPAFPPHDAWLSGHAISYYYFGYVMVASLARLTGTDSAVAFNLGIALLFALTATGALGVVMNLITLAKPEGVARRSSALRRSFWPGLLGPLLVVVAGNFYGVLRLAHANGMLANLQVPAVWYDFGSTQDPGAAQPEAGGEREPGVRAGLINVWEWLDIKGVTGVPGSAPAAFNWDPGYWWWFNGARVVHDRNLVGVETEAIDEMPIFSFILGDMHPHVLALPFVLLAAGLALEWLLWGAGQKSPAQSHPPPTLDLLALSDRLLLSGVVLGGLSFLNTWDFPIYWFLTVVALAVGLGLRWGWETLVGRWRDLGLLALAFAALGFVLYLPFYLTFQSQAGGLLPNLIYPTRFQQTVVFFGPVLVGVALFTAWLFAQTRTQMDRAAALWAGGGLVGLLVAAAVTLTLAASLNPELVGFVDRAIAPLTRDEAMSLLLQRRLVDSLATLFPAALVGLTAGLGVGVLRKCAPQAAEAQAAPALSPTEEARPWRRRLANPHPHSIDLRSPALLMTLAMFLTGALLLVGPEYLYLRDNFGTRMNTIFKFYFQAWVLWGLASAFGLWYVFQHARPVARWVTGVTLGAAILAGLVYTVAGVYSKASRFAGPPTLNGMAYFARDYPDDWAAIQWLQQNVQGAPVILEGTRGAYWLEGRSSRISMATGLPTVLGWANHEGQWRGAYFARVAGREQEIQQVYQVRDWNTARAILDAYDVEYVLVSSVERGWYNPLYQPKFEQNMDVAYHSGDVTIYWRVHERP
jgi:YYY domain-containing protein